MHPHHKRYWYRHGSLKRISTLEQNKRARVCVSPKENKQALSHRCRCRFNWQVDGMAIPGKSLCRSRSRAICWAVSARHFERDIYVYSENGCMLYISSPRDAPASWKLRAGSDRAGPGRVDDESDGQAQQNVSSCWNPSERNLNISASVSLALATARTRRDVYLLFRLKKNIFFVIIHF